MHQMHMKGAGMLSPSMSVPNAGDNTSSSDPTNFNPQIDPHRSAPPPFAPNGVVTPNSMSNLSNRPPMQQNKPGQMMPPPSSPATNGKPGQPSNPQVKPEGPVGMMKTESSPRSQASAPPGSAGGAGPSTPAIAHAQTSNVGAPSPSQPVNNPSRPPTATTTPAQAPSGSATPAVQPAVPPPPTTSVSMPSLDDFNFNSLDDLSSIFGSTGNTGAVDFEQDFSEWFTNDLGILETK